MLSHDFLWSVDRKASSLSCPSVGHQVYDDGECFCLHLAPMSIKCANNKQSICLCINIITHSQQIHYYIIFIWALFSHILFMHGTLMFYCQLSEQPQIILTGKYIPDNSLLYFGMRHFHPYAPASNELRDNGQ